MKILVVEDDQAVAQSLRLLCSSYSYAVDTAADGETGWEMADAYEYDLILLDVILPGLDGITLCRKLRAKGLQTPILLLTGQEGGRQKAIALNAGADDYVVKPFDAEELIARVQALLRRGGVNSQTILTWGQLSVDPSRRTVAYGTQLLPVTPKEYAILELLLRHPQKALSSRAILDHVWSSLDSPGEEVVRVHIKELRQKLTATGAPKDWIKTKHGVGYQLNPLYASSGFPQTTDALSPPQVAEMSAVNEELRATLAQLRSTQAELQQKNQELELSYQIIEQERQQLQAARAELAQRVAERTAELRQREELLSSIYDGAEQALFVIDVSETNDFRYVSFNHVVEQYSGVKTQNAQGKTPEEVFGTAIGAAFRQNYDRCLQAGQSITYEEYVEFANQALWELTTLSPLRNEQGRIYRLVGTGANITDRKQTETALQQSEELLRLTLDLNSIGMWEWNLETGTSTWNDHNYRLLGYQPGEVEPSYQLWRSHIHPDDIVDVEQKLAQALVNQTKYEAEFRLVLRDGSIRWELDKGRAIYDKKGQPVRMIGVAFDISDRKRREANSAFLTEIATDLSQLSSPEEIMQTVGAKIGSYLDITNCLFAEINDAQDQAIINHSWHQASVPTMLGVHRLSNFLTEACRQAARNRETVVVCNTHVDPRVNAERYAAFNIHAHVCVPFHQNGEWKYSFVINTATPRNWHDDEIELICEITNRIFPRLERARAEAALQKNEEILRLALAGARAGTWDWNLQTGVNTWSPESYTLQGLDPAAGVPSYEEWANTILHPADREQLGREMASLLEQRMPEFQLEFRIIHPQTGVRWILSRGQLSCNAQGEPIRLSGINLDITEFKQLELSLQASEGKLSRILDNTLGAIASFRAFSDHTWQHDYFSAGCETLFGYSSHEFMADGRLWMSRVLPADRDTIFVSLFDDFFAERNVTIEYRFQHRDGSVRWLSSTYASQQIESNCWQVTTVTQDITDRKQAELALQESEARFRLMANHAPVLIWLSGIDGTYSFFNQAWLKFTGQHFDEAINSKAWAQAMHPDDVQPSRQTYLSAFEARQPFQMEYRLKRADGEYRWIEDRGVPRFATNGEFSGFIGSCQDIHDRKLAEVSLWESEQRLQTILDNSPAAVYMIDFQNRHLLVNRCYAGMLSIAPAELVGKSLYDVWPVETAAAFAASNHTVLETGKLLQIEDTAPLADGVHSYITVKFPLRDETGTPYAICGISTDITEKKLLENQFYRAQRLESLGTLASGIAHDLNNVLTPIVTLAQLLRLKQTNLDAPSQEMLRIVEDSAKRGANLIHHMLTFTRGTGGERTPIEVTAALQEVINVIEQTFPKSIRIHPEIPIQSPGLVSADATYLNQVLMNLCVNARDAMPDGGMLSLAVEHCFVDQTLAQTNLDAQVGSYVVMTVADTGTGIPPEIRDQIFEPFFTTKRFGQGTGLGLATVLGIVREYGGFLQVLSEVGQGTQVKVYLPAIGEIGNDFNQHQKPQDGHGELVLLVDDDVAVQLSTQSLLENHHYRVVSTNDGAQAIDLYAQHQADIQVVILDIMMPNMSGITLIQSLKAINPAVKIIAMSGLSANRGSAIAAGATIFLPKPYTLERLLEKLRALI